MNRSSSMKSTEADKRSIQSFPFLKGQTISVVIPAFQEEAVIGEIIQQIQSQKGIDEIIVVDDGSEDQTAKNAREAGAKVFSRPYNMGNGAAVKKGIRMAKGDIVILMDGDGQHSPDDFPDLLQPMEHFDMVIGARNFRGHSSFFRMIANSIYNRFASYITKRKIEDLTSGFRAIRRNILMRYLYLLPNTFSYPSTITLAMMRSGHSVQFIPIQVRKRKGTKSKIRIFRDGFRFFLIITKIAMLFSPLRVFLPISGLLALGSLGNYLYTFLMFHKFTNMSALLGMTSVLTFMLGLIAEQIAMLRMDRSEDEN